MKFKDYFSFEAIVNDLIRWRIKRKDVDKVLPPRRMWSRAGVKDRKGMSPETVRRQSIWRAVHCVFDGSSGADNLSNMRWAENLRRLVDEVRAAVFSGNVAFEKPEIFAANTIAKFQEKRDLNRYLDKSFKLTKEQKKQIKDFWKPYCRVSPKWVQYYVAKSGIFDPRYIPNDLFYTKIDQYFNNRKLGYGFNDKNYYSKIFADIKQPEIIVRKINGFVLE